MPLRIDEFVADLHKSPSTCHCYAADMRRFEVFLSGREITEKLARKYILYLEIEKRNQPASIARVGYAIRKYCKWAHITPMDLELPTITYGGKPNYFTEDEIKRLLEAAKTPFEKALLMLLYETGMRIGELLQIKMSDVNWENGVITIIRKGNRPGEVAVRSATLLAVQRQVEWLEIKQGLIFPYTYFEVRRWFQLMERKAGLKRGGLHILRHSRAVHLRLAGQPLEDISDTLGHSNLTVTEKVYAQIQPEILRDRIKKPFWQETD